MISKKYGCLPAVALVLVLRIGLCSAWFEYCDHTVRVNNSLIVNSPYYPNRYPSGSSCRYTIEAPLDYEIAIECNINLDKTGSTCTSEFFYISVDGDKEMRGSEYLCGVGYIQRNSMFNRIVIAYTSQGGGGAGTFSCSVTARPQPCDCGWSITPKITGGRETGINEFPFIVAMYNTRARIVFCSGTIISHRHILSAAHCYQGAYAAINEMVAVVGEHDLKTESETPYTRRHRVYGVKIHENYNQVESYNDIAIVTTATVIEWSRGVGPICLPLLYAYATFDGRDGEIAGWGATSFAGPRATVLMKASVRIISNSQCRQNFVGITESQMCTYSPPRDACQYDSGGPLFVRLQRLFGVGVISYGMACGVESPAVYVRITSYLRWIENNTPNTMFCRRT